MDRKYCMTVPEAAEYVSVGRQTLRNLLKENVIPSIMIGQRELVLVNDLEKFMSINRGMDLLNTAELRPVVASEVRA